MSGHFDPDTRLEAGDTAGWEACRYGGSVKIPLSQRKLRRIGEVRCPSHPLRAKALHAAASCGGEARAATKLPCYSR